MILCLDVGNSQIHGGVFSDQGEIKFQFRKTSKTRNSSDEYGLFLRSVLRENDIDPVSIEKISLCTVVPEELHSLKSACFKYFGFHPFVLKAGVKTGLKIDYTNPIEVGSDRIANAIAASQQFPQENLIIVDLGTATTFCAVSADKRYLGGAIFCGLRMAMEALEKGTSKLPSVELMPMRHVVGRNTTESLQSGLYFGMKGVIHELVEEIKKEKFKNQDVKVIGTGGFSSLYRDRGVFDIEIPELALNGLFLSLRLNA